MDSHDHRELRQAICEAGARLYARGLVAGNDGNISCRLPGDSVLCTPSLISKGCMTPPDLCVVQLDGRQLDGARRCTSEIALHLEIYRADAAAGAVVHSHPPHVLAFAMTGQPIPTGILPECEVFLGAVPTAPYETPGGAAFAATIRPFIGTTNAVVLANHGSVSWGATLEQALWWTEMLDHYCRVLILARQVGPIQRLPREKVLELLRLRPRFGLPADPRAEGAGELYRNAEFGAPPR